MGVTRMYDFEEDFYLASGNTSCVSSETPFIVLLWSLHPLQSFGYRMKI
jgi:hypothetical protein